MCALKPRFIDPTLAPGPPFLTLALVFATVDAVTMLAYAALGSASSPRCTTRLRQ
jgi:hypothetical protein